jgi:UDP-glucose 4-epimerase
MRVLVTGALGFAGQAVARRLLADGHEVVALASSAAAGSAAAGSVSAGSAAAGSRVSNRPVPPGAELRVADLRDAAATERAVDGVDGVCHLAALTRVRDSADDPVRYFDVNVGGTLNLLRAMGRRAGAVPNLIFCSSGAVYGRREGTLSESDPAEPVNPYGTSKLAAEHVIAHLAATGRIAAVTLRCFNIAGAVDGLGDGDLTRIIPRTLAVAAGEGKLMINGDGSAVREYTHVTDVAAAFALALAAAEPGEAPVYNVGSGRPVTLAELVAAAEKVTGRTVEREHQPAKPEARVLMADSTKIRAELGWRPERSSLEQILADGWAARLTAGERESTST